MITVSCKWCHEKFDARVADRKRGWGLFCSKKCKAKLQECHTGQWRELNGEQNPRADFSQIDQD